MTWVGIKYGLKKAWLWCKHNWKIVALAAYTLLLYVIFSKNARNAKKVLELQQEFHKKEMEALTKAHKDQLKKREENLEKYKLTLELIEKRRVEGERAITEREKKRVKEIVEASGDDPAKLAELIKEEFGFEIWND
jgi:esterase/lipase|tara:strand:+ start:692 stop:1099 length:408 start_codon:yes stop_codon:yes gene_type:complete